MTYNLHALFEEIDAKLSLKPRVSLSDLAQYTGVERHTIEKAIRQCKGLSFQEYQKKKLVATAQALLREDATRSGKQIAWILGYRSNAAFTRFIRRATGRTPSEIKKIMW